jgi:aldehyde:ferredoxin oxidoreductase
MTGIENGKWDYINLSSRYIEKAGFEEWKTTYYTLEGWESQTGYPERKTLSALGMDYVADELAAKKLLGKSKNS